MPIKKSALRSTLLGMAFSTFAFHTNAAMLQDNLPQASGNDVPIAAERRTLNNQLIIKYRPSVLLSQSDTLSTSSNVLQQTSRIAGATLEYVRPMSTGHHVVRVKGKLTEEKLVEMLSKIASDSNVESIEVDRIFTIQATPNDPRFGDQWHYTETTGGINVEDAWDTTTGQGAVVAVIDTGYVAHSDLAANILPGYDFISDAGTAVDGDGRDSNPADPGDHYGTNECGPFTGPEDSSWHGTHVAGTIAAVSNNNKGVAGIAYDAKVVPVRVLGKCGGSLSDIADAIVWSAGGSVAGVPTNQNPADVINMSLGGGGACGSAFQSAVNSAVSAGATVVVASGNSNQNASNATPANCNNVVAVSSTTRAGNKAFYSNFGSVVDLSAPGGETSRGSVSDGVLSTLNSGATTPASENYEYYQGTSMAAPHVAGVAALMYAAKPSVTPTEVENALKSTARSFPGTCSQCGTGIVDANAAVAAVSGGGGGGSDTELENGVPVTGLAGAQGSEQFFTFEVPAGATNLTFTMSGGFGDADIYSRFGAKPTTSTYTCRPYASGNNENCDYSSPAAGTWHVMIRGYSEFGSVSLVANYTTSSGNETISASNLSGNTGSWQDFEIDVPAGRSSLNIQMNGGSGDADLYVRYGSNPTTSTYDCRPYTSGNSENCSFNNPQSGKWYVRVRAYRTYSGVSLSGSSQ